MSEELETCPKCGNGKLRPDSKVGWEGEPKEPFRETSSMRFLFCDNPECTFKRAVAGLGEYH